MAEVPVALLREALSAGRPVWIRARGHSMRPLIPDGSRCLILPASHPTLPGTVVACARGDTLVIHRVLAWAAHGVLTAGDGARRTDPLWPVTDVIGIIAQVERPSGRSLLVNRPPWRLLGRLFAAVRRVFD